MNIVGIVQRIFNELQNSFKINTNQVIVTPSIGIAIYPEHGKDYEALIKKADKAMFKKAKKRKKIVEFLMLN